MVGAGPPDMLSLSPSLPLRRRVGDNKEKERTQPWPLQRAARGKKELQAGPWVRSPSPSGLRREEGEGRHLPCLALPFQPSERRVCAGL